MSRSRVQVLLVVAFLGLVTLACRYFSPTPVAWSGTSTALSARSTLTVSAPTAAATAPATSAPPTLAVQPTRSVATNLPSDGPWLIFPNEDDTSLYALDRDTGELTALNLPPLVDLSDLTAGIAPNGSSLVLRAGNLDGLENLGVYELKNPFDPPKMISPLLSDFVIKAVQDRKNPQAAFALQAVLQPNALAWKPNSQSVVFPAAIEGVAANLRVYQPLTGKTERLTVRYQQNFSPLWNSSGQTLLFQEVDTLNNPTKWEPYLVTSLNLGNPGNLFYLYTPPASGLAEVFAGWINPAQAVSYTQTEEGNQFVRILNAGSGGSVRVIFSGLFDEIAVAPDRGEIALIVGQGSAVANGTTPGLYITDSALTKFNLVAMGDFSELSYAPAWDLFFASGEMGLVSFTSKGVGVSLAGETYAGPSPDGSWLLTWGKRGAHLRSPDGTLLQEVTSDSVSALVWQRDSKGFYLLLDGDLFHYTFPLLRGNLAAEDVSRTDGSWFVWLGKER